MENLHLKIVTAQFVDPNVNLSTNFLNDIFVYTLLYVKLELNKDE